MVKDNLEYKFNHHPKKNHPKKEQAMMRDCNQRRFELQALAGQVILKIQNILKSRMIIVSNRIEIR